MAAKGRSQSGQSNHGSHVLMSMQDGSRQMEEGPGEVACRFHRDSTCVYNCSRGFCSVLLLLSLYLRSKSIQAGPWLGCDHQGKHKEKGRKTTDGALGCIQV